ncbi:MAG TPA: hypothetical protein DIW31_00775, partial [Bacteroidales bacterium]|nr:hypothetical protein [Bacteroidales bacterium]
MGRRKKNFEAEITNERFSREEKTKKVFAKRILTGKEVQEKLDSSVFLLSVTEDLTKELSALSESSNQVYFIADAGGCLIKIFGSKQLLSKIKENFIIPGVYPDEDSILAKAIGGAIIGNEPIRVDGIGLVKTNGGEWSALSAPIRDTNNESIGAFGFLVPKSSVCEHTMQFVNIAANLLNQNFANRKREVDLHNVKEYHNAVFNQHPFANLTVDNNGIIINISRQAATYFGVIENEIIGTNIANILPIWGNLWQKVKLGNRIENINVDLVNVPGISDYLLSVAPVVLPDATIDGAILAFRDLKKVNNVVNRFTGNWASYTFDDIIGVSVLFKKTVELAKKIALETSPVLISGEIGIG